MIQLNKLKIPRCSKSDAFGKVVSVELARIVMGSDPFYRKKREQGQVHCAIVTSKSKSDTVEAYCCS